jgi:ribosomal protein S18 acetylase RimI-like enzyme
MLPPDVIIRPVLLSDAEALLRLRLEALQDSPEAFGEDYAYVAAQPYAAWIDQIAHSLGESDRTIYVAVAGVAANSPNIQVDEARLIGMAGVNRSTMRNTRHAASVWGVYVQPAWRGRGVATALVRACVVWGRAKGLVTMRLAVITDTPAAICCYESCGFRSCGVDPKRLSENPTFVTGDGDQCGSWRCR